MSFLKLNVVHQYFIPQLKMYYCVEMLHKRIISRNSLGIECVHSTSHEWVHLVRVYLIRSTRKVIHVWYCSFPRVTKHVVIQFVCCSINFGPRGSILVSFYDLEKHLHWLLGYNKTWLGIVFVFVFLTLFFVCFYSHWNNYCSS